MVKKKTTTKKKTSKKKKSKINLKKVPSSQLKNEQDIAMDFSIKVYQKFNKIIKSIVLFGSSVKKDKSSASDIDIIIIIDDVSINWDQKLITWYREELDKILRGSPYKKEMHINTVN